MKDNHLTAATLEGMGFCPLRDETFELIDERIKSGRYLTFNTNIWRRVPPKKTFEVLYVYDVDINHWRHIARREIKGENNMFTKKEIFDAYTRATKVWMDSHHVEDDLTAEFRRWACSAIFLGHALCDIDEIYVPPYMQPVLKRYMQTHICVAKCPEMEGCAHCMGDGNNDEYYNDNGCCRAGNEPKWEVIIHG